MLEEMKRYINKKDKILCKYHSHIVGHKGNKVALSNGGKLLP